MKLTTRLTVWKSWDDSRIKNAAESLFGEIKAFVEIPTASTFYFDDSKAPWIVARGWSGRLVNGQCIKQCDLEAFLRKWCQMVVKQCRGSAYCHFESPTEEDIELCACTELRIEIADKECDCGLRIVCFDIRNEDEIFEGLQIVPCVPDCLSYCVPDCLSYCVPDCLSYDVEGGAE